MKIRLLRKMRVGALIFAEGCEITVPMRIARQMIGKGLAMPAEKETAIIRPAEVR